MPSALSKKLFEECKKKSIWASQNHYTDVLVQSELILQELKKLTKEVTKLREVKVIK